MKIPAATIFTLLSLAPVAWGDDGAAARAYYLDPLVRHHDYTPQKTSFIFQGVKSGERRTLLDVAGSGSVRHLWLTWCRSFAEPSCASPGQTLLRAFVDGETTPSIEGAVDELFAAANATGSRYVPQPAFVNGGSFNLYLPLFFARRIRLEVEALDNLEELYAQVDYRTTRRAESRARLVSERGPEGTVLRYLGEGAPRFDPVAPVRALDVRTGQINLSPGSPVGEMRIDGRGIIRRLSLSGDLSDLALSIHWDGATTPAVNAPLRYLFAGFDTLAVESRDDVYTLHFPMPFQKGARIRISASNAVTRIVNLTVSVDRRSKANGLRFHAVFAEDTKTTGFSDYVALATQGDGHFVGLSLFDSGHNHGGGDTALIDADSERPLVLHGICAEDYFSFAWHGTGTMHALAGAPVHEARYRFHLENPYPFRSSLLFTFGTFANQSPKSVAFYYQRPARSTRAWESVSPRFRVLGPLTPGTIPPATDDAPPYPVEVRLAKPERFQVSWQEAVAHHGFLDLTHHYRHFLMTEKGTGFVAGEARMRIETCLRVRSDGKWQALLGHDDAVEVKVNGVDVAAIKGDRAFSAARIELPLNRGWNRLSFVADNTDNLNWRWFGLSLAFKATSPSDLDFANPPCPVQTSQEGPPIDHRPPIETPPAWRSTCGYL